MYKGWTTPKAVPIYLFIYLFILLLIKKNMMSKFHNHLNFFGDSPKTYFTNSHFEIKEYLIDSNLNVIRLYILYFMMKLYYIWSPFYHFNVVFS